jgi:hypothetical protein
MTRTRKIALVLAAITAALTLQSSPALAARASGVCGGVEIPPGSNNC